MTIGNYGSMEIGNKENLKLFLKIYFGLWHYRFNYNNYKKNVYPLLLNKKYYDNDTKAETDIDNLNIDSVIMETKVDNNLILWELKTVKSQIKNINAYLKQGGYRGNFNLENKKHKDAFNAFLKTLNEFDTKTIGEVYLQEVISHSDENWQVFFLNVLLKDYLKIESFLIKKIQLDKLKTETGKEPKNPIKKETLKDKYLYDIGLKLATGELDEYLIFDKDGKRTGAKLSYPKLADKFNLDQQHLKCTLSDRTDQSNKSKNLLYNPEIIEKVLTHLKSKGKEPKEWFLKEFKK